MRLVLSLAELATKIRTSESALAVFDGDVDTNLPLFQAVCHPDLHPGDDQAKKLFNQLGELADEARKPKVSLKGAKRQYILRRRLAVGDGADVYLASSGEHTPPEYIAKVARVDGAAALLEHERTVLTKIIAAGHASPKLTTYTYYFPTVVESIAFRDGFAKRANIFLRSPGHYTLRQIKEQYPYGLGGRHLAWIFKRLLTAVGFAHRQGVAHTSIVPEHILIDHENHGLQLLDWIHSTDLGHVTKTISGQYRDWYPKEVLEKQPVLPGTDLWMAAKCMIYLGGGDVKTGKMPRTTPAGLQRYFRACLLESPSMRPHDAWKFLDDVTEELGKIYGKPRFMKLVLN